MKTQTTVVVRNTGNMELPAIDLKLSVDTNYQQYFTATKSLNQPLLPGDSVEIMFDDAYTVPWIYEYDVNVHAYLVCDSSGLNVSGSMHEYADMNDLSVAAIEKPEEGITDAVNSSQEVTVVLQNKTGKSYNPGEVSISILITDTNGVRQGNIITEDNSVFIDLERSISHLFSGKYTVPALKQYYLAVYIQAVDQYNQNDTLRILRQTNHVGISNLKEVSFRLEQNIPNPAKGNTVINYSIPQDGEINFQLYSVNGQLLYSQKEEALSGDNKIEVDISNYASGIYFYVMEYQGQRITKRMSIKR
jgi:hypothetical protein